jgi:hypothetical protein
MDLVPGDLEVVQEVHPHVVGDLQVAILEILDLLVMAHPI